MFCSQCGKKVTDTMLFCPFCGSAIVLPDQDEPEEQYSLCPEPAPKQEFVPLNLETDWDREDVKTIPEQESFRPLDLRVLDDLDSDSTIRVQTPARPEDISSQTIRIQSKAEETAEETDTPTLREKIQTGNTPTMRVTVAQKTETGTTETIRIQSRTDTHVRDELIRLEGRVPDLNHVQAPQQTGGRANTHIPEKAFNPNDMFMDGDKDRYDEYDNDTYTYEEPEEGNFFIRHIRGIVALTLFAVVALIVVLWTVSGNGQLALARANLAWRASAYEELAFAAYEDGRYAQAAGYYERALARSVEYKYANNAGIAYYQAGDAESASKMAKRAIEIDPSQKDAYDLLLRLYPDSDSRPWEVASLLQSGYQLTGESTFKME